ASLIIGESHQFTSIIRYFGGISRRTKGYKLQRLPFWLLYATFATVAILAEMRVPFDHPVELALVSGIGFVSQLSMALFPVVLMQHFTAQAKAIGLVYCGMHGYKLSRLESFVLSFTAWLLVIAGGFALAMPFGFTVNEENMAMVRTVTGIAATSGIAT